jgi:hypothetical protein
LIGSVDLDRVKAGVGEHRLSLSNRLGPRSFVAAVCGASRRDQRIEERDEKSFSEQEMFLAREIIYPTRERQNDNSASASKLASSNAERIIASIFARWRLYDLTI